MDLERFVDAVPGARWSLRLSDASTGAVLAERDPGIALPAASVGKLVLLARLAALLDDEPSIATEMIDRRPLDPVADSGIWRHLGVDRLSIADAAALVFAVSDNLATNALLARLGLEDVRDQRQRYGFRATDLCDVVRDHRPPEVPSTLSTASATELVSFMTAVHRGEMISPAASAWLRRGLSLSVELSMVPHALGLDPLAHAGPDTAPGVANKTGADVGVRADTGLMATGDRVIAYAVICSFAAGVEPDVIDAMRAVGRAVIDQAGRRHR